MVRILLKACICVLVCLLANAAAWADGTVYAMTNVLGNNQILVFHRAADGPLSLIQIINTGGGGSGLQLVGVNSLGSQGSLQLDAQHHFLFATNTESVTANNGAGPYNTDCSEGTITSFVVAGDGTLTFADRVFSRGMFPNSLAVRLRPADITTGPKILLYVLNAGGPEAPAVCGNLQPGSAAGTNISGFSVDPKGRMASMGATQPIDPGPASGSGVRCVDAAGFAALTGAPAADFQCGLNPPSAFRSPAQIRFTPSGDQLVVTEKGTNTIYVFPLNVNGIADTPTTEDALGPALPTYSGFTFDKHGHLLVTELFGTAVSIPSGGTGAVSSYFFATGGDLGEISADVGDGGTAPCCIAIEPIAGKFAYVVNNLSASISSYTVGYNGSVTLLDGAAATGSGPNDLATARDGTSSFLYVINGGSGTIGAYRINTLNGSLTALAGGSGLPFSAQGIAAY